MISNDDVVRYGNLLKDMRTMGDKKFTGSMVADHVNFQHRFSYHGKRLTQTAKSEEVPAKVERSARKHTINMLRMAGYKVFDKETLKCLELLDYLGVFSPDSIMISSHAYAAISNNLGVSSRSDESSTNSTPHITFVQDNVSIQLQKRLIQAGFSHISDGNYKTTFIHANKVTVDFLVPIISIPDIETERMEYMGVPMHFLPYLIAYTDKRLMMTKYGTLAYVPDAARFAFYKCMVAEYRNDDVKRSNDIQQAESLFSILIKRHGYYHDERIKQAWKELPRSSDVVSSMTKFFCNRELFESILKVVGYDFDL